jgi:hypothetical protein
VAPAFSGLGGDEDGARATDATGDRSPSGGQSASLRTRQRRGPFLAVPKWLSDFPMSRYSQKVVWIVAIRS